MDRTRLPMLLCVDEEGGTVARVSNNSQMNIPAIENMSAYGERGNAQEAYALGERIGDYLSDLGFNVDFAPVADVLSNPQNQVVQYRAFGSDSELVSLMAENVSNGLRAKHLLTAYKHFPGHGSTSGDTHQGYAASSRTLEELEAIDLVPFYKGIEDQVPMIMVGHISFPNIITEDVPASLSYEIITDLLRNKMGYNGLVITDALNMGAIAQHYSAAEAAIKALEAGADLLLMPSDFNAARQGVLDAVYNGRLGEERIEQSLQRIISAKLKLMQP